MFEIILGVIGIITLVSIVSWIKGFYVKVSPDEIAIIVGRGKSYELRTSGFKKPILEHVYFMGLCRVNVDVQT